MFFRIGYGHRAAVASYKAFPDFTLATDEARRVGVSCPFRTPLIALKCHRPLHEDVWARSNVCIFFYDDEANKSDNRRCRVTCSNCSNFEYLYTLVKLRQIISIRKTRSKFKSTQKRRRWNRQLRSLSKHVYANFPYVKNINCLPRVHILAFIEFSIPNMYQQLSLSKRVESLETNMPK